MPLASRLKIDSLRLIVEVPIEMSRKRASCLFAPNTAGVVRSIGHSFRRRFALGVPRGNVNIVTGPISPRYGIWAMVGGGMSQAHAGEITSAGASALSRHLINSVVPALSWPARISIMIRRQSPRATWRHCVSAAISHMMRPNTATKGGVTDSRGARFMIFLTRV